MKLWVVVTGAIAVLLTGIMFWKAGGTCLRSRRRRPAIAAPAWCSTRIRSARPR
jgi:hypothetical protein